MFICSLFPVVSREGRHRQGKTLSFHGYQDTLAVFKTIASTLGCTLTIP